MFERCDSPASHQQDDRKSNEACLQKGDLQCRLQGTPHPPARRGAECDSDCAVAFNVGQSERHDNRRIIHVTAAEQLIL